MRVACVKTPPFTGQILRKQVVSKIVAQYQNGLLFSRHASRTISLPELLDFFNNEGSQNRFGRLLSPDRRVWTARLGMQPSPDERYLAVLASYVCLRLVRGLTLRLGHVRGRHLSGGGLSAASL